MVSNRPAKRQPSDAEAGQPAEQERADDMHRIHQEVSGIPPGPGAPMQHGEHDPVGEPPEPP